LCFFKFNLYRYDAGHVHVADPKWAVVAAAAAAGGGERERAFRSRPKLPPLMVAVDTSYDQDSQRAIRSVAKQLSECLGVIRRAAGKNNVDVELTFASWRGAVVGLCRLNQVDP
jgi:hypothetical protein